VLLYLSLLGIFYASLQIVQTADAQLSDSFKLYENPKFGLTVSYPPNWAVDELRNDPAMHSDNSIVAIFKSPSQGMNDKYLENVIINVQGPRSDLTSLEVYTQESTLAFRSMSEINIIESGNDTLSGLPASHLYYTSTGIPGLNLKKLQLFTVLNNTAFVVTYGAEQSEFDKNFPDVEKLINSIKISSNSPILKQEPEQIQLDLSAIGGNLIQLPSVPTDFPNNNANVLKIDVFSAKKDAINNWHIKGQVTNTGTATLEYVDIVAHFYDNNNQPIGVTTCCYASPETIEPGHTSAFDSFVGDDDLASIPSSYRLSFNWR
jgi:hypothetical protein